MLPNTPCLHAVPYHTGPHVDFNNYCNCGPDCSLCFVEAGVEAEVVLVDEEALTRVAGVAVGVVVVAEGAVEAGAVVVA